MRRVRQLEVGIRLAGRTFLLFVRYEHTFEPSD